VLPLLERGKTEFFSEPSRWGTGDLEQSWVRKELVVEVRYDKVQGSRFRHGTKWLRWRDDKDPKDCTWRELRPPRDPNAPGVESLLSS
jgi:ATP-dependent DNA ligase